MNWIGRLLRRSQMEKELDREMQFHLDAAAADHVRAGMNPEDARRRARMEFGGPAQMKDAARDARGTRWAEDFLYDCRFALRGMRRSPAFAAAAILTMAIGVGANTAVWSIMDALLRRSLPIDRPQTLNVVGTAGKEDEELLFSYPLLQRIQAELGTTSEVAGMATIARLYAAIAESPEPVLAQVVTGNFFQFLGVHARAGRLITPADDRAVGESPVVVISDAFWERRFGRDPAAVGRGIRLNGFPVTIVGVLQPGFAGLTIGSSVDVFAPAMMQHQIRFRSNASIDNADGEKPWGAQNGVSWLVVLTRADEATRRRVADLIDRPFRANLAAEAAGRDSASRAQAMRDHIGLLPIPTGFSGLRDQFGDPLRALLAGVAIILVLTCANLAGLTIARGEARSHEMAVRSSLGAMSGRLVRQVITESLLLALIGGIAGIALARWLIAALLLLASTGSRAIPLEATLGLPVLMFGLALTLAAGLFVGLIPALRARRHDLYSTFRLGGRLVGGARRLPLGRVLVAGQIALALVLVASAGVFVSTLRNFMKIDTGFDRQSVVTARIDMRAAGFAKEDLPGVHQRLLDAARGVPGVQSASLSNYGLGPGVRSISAYAVPGRAIPSGETQGQANYVSPGYFRTVGVPLQRGRDFTAADVAGGPPVAIVTEAFAKHFFGGTDVVGRRFGYVDGSKDESSLFEVVGVARDLRVNGLREKPPRMVYYPLAQQPTAYIQSVDVRIAGPAAAVIPALRAAIGGVDARLPLREVLTVGAYVERSLSRERLVARLASGFGILALTLAAIGLYGVISYSVARRTNEMGVRLALGASPGRVSWLVLRDSLVLIVTGLAVGVALWFPVLSFTRSLLYGVSPHDPMLLAGSIGVLVLAGVTAGLIPALRASRIDPIEAIRAE